VKDKGGAIKDADKESPLWLLVESQPERTGEVWKELECVRGKALEFPESLGEEAIPSHTGKIVKRGSRNQGRGGTGVAQDAPKKNPQKPAGRRPCALPVREDALAAKDMKISLHNTERVRKGASRGDLTCALEGR